jgi:uncharacterized protein YecE (DUF72 family)
MGTAPVPVWIGTAGYSWPDWVGQFYPPGTSPARMLAYYATQFPAVEINNTFYRPPTAGQLVRLADRTPAGFRFSLKVPRSVSHDRSDVDLDPFRRAVDELAARDRLIGLVLQFPEAFTNTLANREWLDRVAAGLKPHPAWVEFRHESWHRPRLGDWLRERGLDLVTVDVPELPQLFPRAVIDPGTTRVYVRLHSRLAGNWYAGGMARYDYDYSDNELREWVVRLKDAGPRVTDAHIIFNNCHEIQGIVNARRLGELLRAEAPAFKVIEPPAPPSPRQATLFGD